MDDTLFQRNLLSLSSKNTALSVKTGNAEPSDKVAIITSKTGLPVPVLKSGEGSQFLHSSVDPVTEGRRFYSHNKSDGYLVFLGLGAGYHILPFLESSDIIKILVIDKDISLFRTIMSCVDLRDFILDPRVDILIDEAPDDVSSYILGNYFPAITGDLKTLSLRSRCRHESDYFESVVTSIKNVISTLSDDYTVQAYFGKKWFKNTVANLRTAEKSTTVLAPARKALVTGAGPSLEFQINDIRARKKDAMLIATDTSLPALLSFDIMPDVVISIDCQHVSYQHFMCGIPPGIPLVLDLASPPGLTKLTDNLVFFSSRHPFSKYVSGKWRAFPAIDVTGGNVSHAAISLADALGAREIYLYGLDFSYPEGKSYARGTYIYPYFTAKSTVLNPLESMFFSFLLRNQNIVKEYENGFIRYTTRPMISYKNRLERAASTFKARLIAIPGRGAPLNLPVPERSERNRQPLLFGAGKSGNGWKHFLNAYNTAIKNLPPPKDPIMEYLRNLTLGERDLWTTLLPSAAAIKREYTGPGLKGGETLKLVRDWAIGVIRDTLHS